MTDVEGEAVSDLNYVKNLSYAEYNKALKDRDSQIERLESVVASYAMTERTVKNETIEECARVAEQHDVGQGWGEAIAAAIRALKDKP